MEDFAGTDFDSIIVKATDLKVEEVDREPEVIRPEPRVTEQNVVADSQPVGWDFLPQMST